MSFITDPGLDRLMGRHAPSSGAFAALLCLAQLAPDAPAPFEVLVQALNAWTDQQQDDLMTLLEGLEERERVIITHLRIDTTVIVKEELLPEVERQLAAIPDQQQRISLLDGVRADVDTALMELVFDVGNPTPTEKEAWHRLFIPHLLHRVADNLSLLPSLATVLACYEPARFDAIVELIPVYLNALPTFDAAASDEVAVTQAYIAMYDAAAPEMDEDDDLDEMDEDDAPDEAAVTQAFVAMYVEIVLQGACLAIEGVTDRALRDKIHAAARTLVTYIEQHHLERSLTGRLHYALLRETSLDEAQTLLRTLFEREGGPQAEPQHASHAHRVAAAWLRRLRQEAPADPMITKLIPFVTAVMFDKGALDRDSELKLGVAECRLVQASLASEAGDVERAGELLMETLEVIEQGVDIGVFYDDTERVDRLIADMNCMQARLAIQRNDLVQARHYYTAAIATLRREHGRRHQLVRQVEDERRRLSSKRTTGSSGAPLRRF
jgi:hypothetical protein